MREVDLPSPGLGSKSMMLRRVAANMISTVEIASDRSSTGSSEATKLKAFFDAASAAAGEAAKISAVMTFTTAGNAKTLPVGGTLATTVGKGGSAGAVTYTTSNAAIATVNSSGVVTGVAVGNVTIRAVMAATATYKARDISIGLTVVAA